jgi:lysophospholipase L1-like esterase
VLQKGALLLAGALAACLVAEALLRAFDYQGLSLMTRHPVLGQTYRPSTTHTILDPEAGRLVEVTTNSLGFRDAEHAPGGAPRSRVVVLGDSLVVGLAVDDKDTLGRVAESRLNQLDAAGDWEVIRLAVAGYGTAQQMLAYSEYGRRFAPKRVVLCFFAGNDVSDNSSEISTNPRIYYRLDEDGRLVAEAPSPLRSRLSGLLAEHSRFYLWQKGQVKRLEAFVRKRVVVDPVHRVFRASEDASLERAWAITRALILRVRDLAAEDGARLLLVYIPFSDEVNPDWWQETLENSPPMQRERWDLARPERLLQSFSLEHGIELLSLRARFLAETAARGTRFYFKHGHLNEAGHRLIGELIAEAILGRRPA